MVQLETPVARSFRVEQVAGMMDVALGEREGEWGREEETVSIRHELMAEVPGVDEPWTIGAIVGPSGSGKTTLARAAFGEICEAREWPAGRAIVDCLGARDWGLGAGESGGTRSVPTTIKEIARVLTAVGLGSVPTWLKPYEVLSTGERFRADLARAVLGQVGILTRRRGGAERTKGGALCASAAGHEDWPPIVFDEFTSALDRVVARTTSAAVARLLRERSEANGQRSGNGMRLVVVTCHTDILPWLAPDWVVWLGGGDGGGVGRPVPNTVGRPAPNVGDGEEARLTRGAWHAIELPLEVRRVPQAMWGRFARHHYLAGGLAASATCYAAFGRGAGDWGLGEARNAECGSGHDAETATTGRGFGCVAFCAVVAALGWKKSKRITRLVVLPEFQGLGVAGRILAEVARIEATKGNRVTITASHPAIVGHCSRSPAWRLVDVKKSGSTRQRYGGREVRCSLGRAVASFEWVG